MLLLDTSVVWLFAEMRDFFWLIMLNRFATPGLPYKEANKLMPEQSKNKGTCKCRMDSCEKKLQRVLVQL